MVEETEDGDDGPLDEVPGWYKGDVGILSFRASGL